MKKVYEAADGTLFDTEKECLEYESNITDLFTAINGLNLSIARLEEVRNKFMNLPKSKLYKAYFCRLNVDLLIGQKNSLLEELEKAVTIDKGAEA